MTPFCKLNITGLLRHESGGNYLDTRRRSRGMTEWKYLPILKWKQGERIALRNLTRDQWKGVTPLIELLPIAAAPNFASLQATLPGYLDKNRLLRLGQVGDQ